MKAIVIDKYRMYSSTAGVIDENLEVLNSIPGFEVLNAEFVAIRQRMDAKLEAAQVKIPFVGPDKLRLKGEITDDVCECMAYAVAWATTNNNDAFIARIHFTPSALRTTADPLFISRCRMILTTVEEVADKLAPYGLTPGVLPSIHEKINSFASLMPESRKNIGKKAVASLDLENELESADEVLVKLDRLVETLKRKHEDVYARYKVARVIVNAATRKASKKTEGEGAE